VALEPMSLTGVAACAVRMLLTRRLQLQRLRVLLQLQCNRAESYSGLRFDTATGFGMVVVLVVLELTDFGLDMGSDRGLEMRFGLGQGMVGVRL